MDILMQAAKSWVNISKSCYIITYGKSKKLHTVRIVFEDVDFYHLAGFQYLTDLALPAVSRAKMIATIFNTKLSGEYIKSGNRYSSMVETRLLALIDLECSLDNDFRMFRYNHSAYPFHTNIRTPEYLIEGKMLNNSLFFFTIKVDESYNGMSIFIKEDKDFSMYHRPLSILKKEKVSIDTQNITILYDRLTTNSTST
ncbi:MAG: PBECR4 domain-containing protein [Defluviitaleaceae bacterium]|nr:PBECR4 domain-containing protein [Defluviitaleaceae bacterium]